MEQNFIVHFLIMGVAVLLTAAILPGVTVKNYGNALIAAVLLAIANTLVAPLLSLLALPFDVLTLGILHGVIAWIIDVLIILLVSRLMSGFQVKNFLWAAIFGFLLSVVEYYLDKIIAWIF
ncbi:phage holin family protein [Pontibacter sp. G13]|uniref:phage holin family protein n=1 Tax=Pontibacter sp. G13 TaxID=3074898 RepID=UPI00288C374D|nr:phage holin family protein [Pontibacter sp. G13]WNJ17677.1 phage holin family protein [Pontibacter sp. G13]